MILMIIYYADIGYQTNFVVKYMCCYVLSGLMLYDFYIFIPIKDKTLQIVYGQFSMNLIVITTIYTFWESFNLIYEYNIFFMIIMI